MEDKDWVFSTGIVMIPVCDLLRAVGYRQRAKIEKQLQEYITSHCLSDEEVYDYIWPEAIKVCVTWVKEKER